MLSIFIAYFWVLSTHLIFFFFLGGGGRLHIHVVRLHFPEDSLPSLSCFCASFYEKGDKDNAVWGLGLEPKEFLC